MSIYNSTKAFALGFETKKLKYFGLAAVAIAVLVLLAIFISTAFNQAITARFFDNPLDMQKKAYTLLEVKVTNITQSDAKNVRVSVSARDNAIFVGPAHKEIKILSTIGHGQYRKLYFLIMPERDVREGSYLVDISATINSKVFKKELELIVKPR